MAPIDQKQLAQRRVLRLLADAGLPAPDEVQFGERCVRFLWHDRKVALVVDLEDFVEIESSGGYTHESVVD